jgi:hypothetical protein
MLFLYSRNNLPIRLDMERFVVRFGFDRITRFKKYYGWFSLTSGYQYMYCTLAAGDLLAALPPMIIFIGLQQYIQKGLLLGAVKK